MRALAILSAVGLLLFLLVILVPFWWIASMSFKTYEQIQFATSIYVPSPFTWENYTGLWTETRFPRWLRNSLVTALVVTVTTTVIASLAGYAVARLRFPGRETVASFVLILYLIPPRCCSSRSTGCLRSWARPTPRLALPVLPDVHRALLHVAAHRLLQGAARRARRGRPHRRGRPRHRLLPRALATGRPGLVASAFFAFTLSWNEFLYALVFIQDERSVTVPVGLNLLIYGDVFHWGQLMAASVITTIPVIALYVFIHRWMVEGLVAGSVKG